jgi:hypothetical protein
MLAMPISITVALFTATLVAPQNITPDRVPLRSDNMPKPFDDWFGIYRQSKKTGYRNMKFVEETTAAGKQYVVHQLDVGRFNDGKNTVQYRESARWAFSSSEPYVLESIQIEEKTGSDTSTVTITRQADGTLETVQKSGKARERKRNLGKIDYTLADVFALNSWARLRPAVDDELKYRHFSVDRMGVNLLHVQVRSKQTKKIDGKNRVVTEFDQLNLVTRRRTMYHIDDQGEVRDMRVAGEWEFRRESADQAKRLD